MIMIKYRKPEAFDIKAVWTELLCDSFGGSTTEDFTTSENIDWEW